MDKPEKFGRVQPYIKRVDMNSEYTRLNDIYMYMQGDIDIDNTESHIFTSHDNLSRTGIVKEVKQLPLSCLIIS